MFAAVSVNAEIVERTEPKPAAWGGFTSIAIGDTNAGGETVAQQAYLYLPMSNRFFTQGNDWGTHATAARTGLKVVVNKYFDAEVEEEWDGASYIIEDSVATQKTWKKWWFVDNGIGMYVDYNNQPDWIFSVEDNGETFRLFGSEKNPNVNMTTFPGQYVGWASGNANDTHVVANLMADVPTNDINWAFVTVSNYAAYEPQALAYEASLPLLEVINEAKGMGINTDEWDAVYNNLESTVEELNAAVEAVRQAIVDFGANNASVENPADMTTSLANPNFDNASSTGWSGTAPNMTGSGSHGPANVAEHFNKTFDTYQNLTDMPDGVYAFEVTAFYRGQLEDYLNHTNYNAYIYAINGTDTLTQEVANPWEAMNTTPMAGATYFGPEAAEASAEIDGVTYYIPNDPSAGRLYFEAGYYKARLMMASNNGKLRLGIKKDVAVTNDWTVFDNFKLTFYGNATEAYRFWANEMKQQAFDYSTMEDLLVTTSYLDAYNEALGGYDQAETYEAILAVKADVAVATDSIKANIKAWADFVAKVNEGAEVAADDQYADSDAKSELADFVEMDASEWIEDAKSNGGTYTTQELKDYVTYIEGLIKKVREGLKEDGDATALLVNPAFTGNANGWTRVAAGGGNVAWGSNCYEAWNNANFDVYQVVENAPAGIYEIEVQGFYRYLRGDNAYNAYADAVNGGSPIQVPAYVYMNDMKTPLVNVYAEPVPLNTLYSSQTQNPTNDPDNWYPDGMISGNEAFTAGMYKSSAYGLVADGQPMRIGVKGATNQGGDSWAIWDNFKLTFRGKNPVAVKAVIDFILPQAWADFDGDIYCNADLMTALEEAIATAEEESKRASIETKDALYEALMNLVKARAALQASKDAYATLKPALDEMEAALEAYGQTASEEALQAATQLYEVALKGYTDGTYLDSEIPAVIEQINEAIAQLKINENEMANASDDNPVDCTDLIVNPDYENNNNTGWSGDEPGFQSYTNAEMYQKNFNYYQDLAALPEGTYEVKVMGFYRHGFAAEDYSLYTQNPNEGNNLFLYAETYEGEDTISYSAPIERLAKYAQVYSNGGLLDGWAAAKTATDTEDGYQVPNNMQTAANAFQDGNYQDNSLIVKVGANGKLRIGLKKNMNHNGDWCIWDGWTLTYYGKQSNKAASDDVSTAITSLEGTATVSRQVYNVNGVRTNGLKKGVNIVRETLSDGTVRIVKITIR